MSLAKYILMASDDAPKAFQYAVGFQSNDIVLLDISDPLAASVVTNVDAAITGHCYVYQCQDGSFFLLGTDGQWQNFSVSVSTGTITTISHGTLSPAIALYSGQKPTIDRSRNLIFAPNTTGNKVTVISIATPSTPTIAHTQTDSTYLASVRIGWVDQQRNNYYSVGAPADLTSWDVTNPLSWARRDTDATAVQGSQLMGMDGSSKDELLFAYVGSTDGNNRLHAWDISDPDTIDHLGSVLVFVGETSGIVYDDLRKIVMITSRGNTDLIIVDASDPSSMVVVGNVNLASTTGPLEYDQTTGIAYIGYQGGVAVFDVNKPLTTSPIMSPDYTFASGTFSGLEFIGARIRSTVVQEFPYRAYKAGGKVPDLVADMVLSRYAANDQRKSFAKLFNFSRAGVATYTDANGVTKTAAANVPRTDHHIWNGSDWVKAGLLLESESRTNFALQSENMSVLPWQLSSASVSGTQKIISNAGSNGQLWQIYSVNNSGLVETISAKAKADGARYLNLGRAGAGCWFDLQNGTVLFSFSGLTGAISGPDADGYRRISVAYIENLLSNGATTQIRIYPSINAPTSSSVLSGGGNDGVGGVLVKEVQRERGPLSSYIPTSTSAATRSGDVLTIPAANLPTYANAISIQMDGVMKKESSEFVTWTADASNGILVESDANDFTFTQETAGVVDVVSGGSFTTGVNVPFNIASRHGSAFVNGAVDGMALTENTTPVALPDLSTTDLQLGFDFTGTIKTFRMWADDIGDVGIAEASS